MQRNARNKIKRKKGGARRVCRVPGPLQEHHLRPPPHRRPPPRAPHRRGVRARVGGRGGGAGAAEAEGEVLCLRPVLSLRGPRRLERVLRRRDGRGGRGGGGGGGGRGGGGRWRRRGVGVGVGFPAARGWGRRGVTSPNRSFFADRICITTPCIQQHKFALTPLFFPSSSSASRSK